MAWALSDQLGIPMVSVCPATVIGPGPVRHTPSTALFQRFIDGTVPAVPPITLSYVDVRDVAEAHVKALLRPPVQQRYTLAGPGIRLWELGELIRRQQPMLKLPEKEMPQFLFPLLPWLDWLSHKFAGTPREMERAIYIEFRKGKQLFDSSKARRDLGWNPRPLSETVSDTFNWLRTERVAPLR